MRSVLRYAAIALLGALPLWLRQRAVERELMRTVEQWHGELSESARDWNRWGTGLVREIERAFR